MGKGRGKKDWMIWGGFLLQAHPDLLTVHEEMGLDWMNTRCCDVLRFQDEDNRMQNKPRKEKRKTTDCHYMQSVAKGSHLENVT